MSVIVDQEKCPQDHQCPAVLVCPVSAIEQEGVGLPKIIIEKCIDCYKCVRFCPLGALQVS